MNYVYYHIRVVHNNIGKELRQVQPEATVQDEQDVASTATQQGDASGGTKRQRTTWTDDQKREVVAEAVRRGKGGGSQVAKEMNIAPNLLYRWMADEKYQPKQGEPAPKPEQECPEVGTPDVQKRLAEIKAEILMLQLEAGNLVLGSP